MLQTLSKSKPGTAKVDAPSFKKAKCFENAKKQHCENFNRVYPTWKHQNELFQKSFQKLFLRKMSYSAERETCLSAFYKPEAFMNGTF